MKIGVNMKPKDTTGACFQKIIKAIFQQYKC